MMRTTISEDDSGLQVTAGGKAPPALLPGLLTAAAVVAAVVSAAQLAWVCDDAFISFRYAKNFAEEKGLVYNVGEIVEGYSNFLWTMFVAGAMWLGREPVAFSEALGVVFFVGTLIALSVVSWRVFGQRGPLPVASLACVAFGVNRSSRVWATGGLETAMFTFWVIVAYALFLRRRNRVCAVLSGLAVALAMMTRVDGGVFGLILGLWALWGRWRRKEVGPLWAFALPAIIVFAPYFLWRWSRYGFLLPNPYYAKSAGLTYWTQGLRYLGLHLATSQTWIVLPLAAAIAWRARWTPHEREAVGLAAVSAVAYTFFVIRAGGCHMADRLLIPVTPFVYLLCEALLRQVRGRKRWALCAGVVVITALALDVPSGWDDWHGITQERHYYPREWLERSQHKGRALKRLLAGVETPLVVGGCQCAWGYYSDLPVVIEYHGLTDAVIAHLPLGERGQVGHEKQAPLGYLLARGVRLSAYHNRYPYNTIRLGPCQVAVLTYDDALMANLKGRPGVELVEFPQYLHEYVRDLQDRKPEEVYEDYRRFCVYYFLDRPDSPLKRPFDEYLRRHGLPIPDESLLAAPVRKTGGRDL